MFKKTTTPYESELQTLAYDAPIKMEIATTMKAVFFGFCVIVYKVSQLSAAVLLFQLRGT